MPDLLLEVGCEEIPARMLDGARTVFQWKVWELLGRNKLSPRSRLGVAITAEELKVYSTPRRLALFVENVPEAQDDSVEVIVGPPVKAAYKEGSPTPAAFAFAKKVARSVDALERQITEKGEYLCATVEKKGKSTVEILCEELPAELLNIYWPKTMYWRGRTSERFVRPIRWFVALMDDSVIDIEIAGIRSGRTSRGHRILSNSHFDIPSAVTYEALLKEHFVLPERSDRASRIWELLVGLAGQDLRIRENDRYFQELLSTVVNLTEWPSVVRGSFDKKFLELPEEVLITVMRDHQKYFAVEDLNGKLAPYFLAVLNIDHDEDGIIRHGNERVLRARFNDAQFFWLTDQKIPLSDRVEMLRNVTFQKDLGSYWAKTERMRAVSTALAREVEQAGLKISSSVVDQAVLLAKTDLTTELVKEFTELQGIVGGLYAKTQRHPQAVADAIYDHYRPESSDDPVPRTIEGALVSLTDKADSIAGMFALGLQPSGSKDPFALRRQANGIVRILAEHTLPLRIGEIFERVLAGYRNSAELKAKLRELESARKSIAEFFRERLEFYLRDVRGFAYDVVNAVLAAGADDVTDAIARAEAVTSIRATENFIAISTAFKRIKNILRQARDTGKKWPEEFNRASLAESAEMELGKRVSEASSAVGRLAKEKDYRRALSEIAQLRPIVDTFFEKVMVMVDDDKLRANRLALLATMQRSFSTIADFSEIVTSETKA